MKNTPSLQALAGGARAYRLARRRGEAVSEQPGWCGARRGMRGNEFRLMLLVMVERLVALGASRLARCHHHRGVLESNAVLGMGVAALASGAMQAGAAQAESMIVTEAGRAMVVAVAVTRLDHAGAPREVMRPESEQSKRPVHHIWVELVARIDEVFPCRAQSVGLRCA
jgi:hypothetical protein